MSRSDSKFDALVSVGLSFRAQDYPDMDVRELKDLIRVKGGSDLKLIIEKKLYPSDVDKGQNWLSMPLKQILSDYFLNRDEKMILNISTENGVDVGFIGPRREETTMVLKKWRYTTSSSYVLTNNWYEMAKKNGLNVDALSRSGSSGSRTVLGLPW